MPTRYKLVAVDGTVVQQCVIGRTLFSGAKQISSHQIVIGVAPSGFDVYLLEPGCMNGNYVDGNVISDRKVGGSATPQAGPEGKTKDDSRYAGAVVFLPSPEEAVIRFGGPESGLGVCLRGRAANAEEQGQGYDRILYIALVGIRGPDVVEEPPALLPPISETGDTLMGKARLGVQPPPPKQS